MEAFEQVACKVAPEWLEVRLWTEPLRLVMNMEFQNQPLHTNALCTPP